ncbi:---NA--- : DNA-binding helix-turn-helix protein OS=Leptospira santarosai str. JET GN=LEP1GSC071_0031 PE=4 SV=1: HTH_31 [Gemmataceae bacterium]|nr:---NA--- : DNA-binding helix-turn-helix protein OS=Leptospira santarosai str. JET GN=LEP1GSC071_0031 PE=4 SV=1: HTH_31 [Gemmataceae bacterium]VTT96568.1 ---NA--- : DNA-binding helix-turn-helix protein OS=Leptospira santarosai str. JET GN=LEP1GSC071_0031 PE=4 SV=1: HTH_31 [Gemmataceae bacterium]
MTTLVAKNRSENVFGRRLRELREARGLTQQALGDLADMAYQTVAKYERGASVPTWPVVERLANALGVKTDEFRDHGE